MSTRLHLATITALVLAFGCDDGDPKGGSGGSAGGTVDDGGATCGGADATVLAGSCTYTAFGLTTCAEDYYDIPLTGTELEVYQQACSGSGYTFSTTDLCPTTDIACKCTDTTGLFKRIKYGYGTYTDDCYSKE